MPTNKKRGEMLPFVTGPPFCNLGREGQVLPMGYESLICQRITDAEISSTQQSREWAALVLVESQATLRQIDVRQGLQTCDASRADRRRC
ncbi:hypothetical protein M3J09_001733 [Ascochyta lentis]